MKFKWLHQQNNASDIIVFFSGWGFSSEVVAHLKPSSNTDVLFVQDYSTLDGKMPDLQHYKKRHLVAWSFGVANFIAWSEKNSSVIFDTHTAINGTPLAIDQKMGIAKRVVQQTIDNFSADNYQAFLNRCGGSNSSFTTSDVILTALKNELNIINQREYSASNNINWDKVIVSQQDVIFPVNNQQRAWHKSSYQLIDAPHNPFDIWSDWQDLLA